MPDSDLEGCEFGNLISRCWSSEPVLRPSFEEIQDELDLMDSTRVTPMRHHANSFFGSQERHDTKEKRKSTPLNSSKTEDISPPASPAPTRKDFVAFAKQIFRDVTQLKKEEAWKNMSPLKVKIDVSGTSGINLIARACHLHSPTPARVGGQRSTFAGPTQVLRKRKMLHTVTHAWQFKKAVKAWIVIAEKWHLSKFDPSEFRLVVSAV